MGDSHGTLGPYMPSLVVGSGEVCQVCISCSSRRDQIPSLFAYHTNTFLKVMTTVCSGDSHGGYHQRSEVLSLFLVEMDMQFGVCRLHDHLLLGNVCHSEQWFSGWFLFLEAMGQRSDTESWVTTDEKWKACSSFCMCSLRTLWLDLRTPIPYKP